ncbi:MAG TPA: AAA family ATPase [Actinomycetes bacterium]|nr:AAA family ATPase [Actinomycetes bacterium]
MELLERADFLDSLVGYATEARAGESRVVLVSGEAGVGKTSLLEAACRALPDARWVWGACDGSATPQPLGPLYDVAGQLGGDLAAAVADGLPRDRLFRVLLDQLGSSSDLTVVAVEDVHWADDATLDLLRFLGKRLRGMPVLLVVSYRDDGLGRDHPLRATLGELAGQRGARRVGLPPLTRGAVDELAQQAGVDPEGLHRLTGGNPFFLVQVLEAGADVVPVSAGDAVLARAARLAAGARDVLDAAAVLGSRVELDLLRAVVAPPDTDVDDCLTTGLLRSDGPGFRWRHEIARLAVESDLPAHRRSDLHARSLRALVERGGTDHTRLAHHAEGAGDAEAVLRHAVPAARRAADLGAHREAAAQYERALRFASGLPPAERAALWEELSDADALLDRWQQVTEARQQALDLWRESGEPLRVGDSLRRLSTALWRMCRGKEQAAALEEAVTVLESLPPSRELGWAYAALASSYMVDGDPEAVPVARRAQRMARRFGDAGLLSHAVNTEGVALTTAGADGLPQLRQSLDIALAADLLEEAGRSYTNLLSTLCAVRRWEEVERVHAEGARFTEERDLTTFDACLRGVYSCALAETGRWDETVVEAHRVLDRLELSPVNRVNALTALTIVLVRRGDPDAGARLTELTDLGLGLDETQVLVPLHRLLAERDWLAGDHDAARRQARAAAEHVDQADAWEQGALRVWWRRLGIGDLGSPQCPEPYVAELAGDWRAAADQWLALGQPYDAALALVGSGDEAGLREAVTILDRLGAAPLLAVAQAEMRRLGVRLVPRGRRQATRADRFGLTPREREVLELLRTGATNAEIAARLVIAEKTVDHHVSAVLGKLGVASRREASTLADSAT